MSDLFGDQGVVKTVIRSSTDSLKPKRGDEVALVYAITSGVDNESKNLVYTVGTNTNDLFVPLRTLDKIVCDMRRNERSSVHISSSYSGKTDPMDVEITLVHVRSGPGSGSNALSSLSPPLGDFQNHLLQNPDVMEQMMSSPYMQSLLSNPETMRSLMGMNPQMQQLLEQNPELNSLMNDPEFLQQSMEAMRNPSVMREMMRNTDRAMSNIESLPGGSAALHKLYNEVQAPLFDAAQDIGSKSSSSNKVTDSTQLKAKYGDLAKPNRPVVEPMANPWDKRPVIPSPVIPPTQPNRPPFDMSAMTQMMQDPAMQQMMSSMFRAQTSPATNLASNNTRNPFEDANFLQRMFNPTTIQAMTQLEQSMGTLGGVQQSPSMNQSFGNFLTAQQNDPEVRFRTQLATLRSMGFTDTQANIEALNRTGGSVDAAIELLMTARQASQK